MSGYSGVAPVLTSLMRGHIKRDMKGELASKTSAMKHPAIILLAFIDSSDHFGSSACRVKATIHGAGKTVNVFATPDFVLIDSGLRPISPTRIALSETAD